MKQGPIEKDIAHRLQFARLISAPITSRDAQIKSGRIFGLPRTTTQEIAQQLTINWVFANTDLKHRLLHRARTRRQLPVSRRQRELHRQEIVARDTQAQEARGRVPIFGHCFGPGFSALDPASQRFQLPGKFGDLIIARTGAERAKIVQNRMTGSGIFRPPDGVKPEQGAKEAICRQSSAQLDRR
jgi:hypothetical protein